MRLPRRVQSPVREEHAINSCVSSVPSRQRERLGLHRHLDRRVLNSRRSLPVVGNLNGYRKAVPNRASFGLVEQHSRFFMLKARHVAEEILKIADGITYTDLLKIELIRRNAIAFCSIGID